MESPPFFLLLLTMITFSGAAAQPRSNITLNSFLTTDTAGARNPSWLSPSGDFAFGFHPLPTNSSLFLLAIWYANLPNTSTTIIWTPNRNKPLPPNSSAILTSNGKLSLRDPAGKEVWSPGASAASYASLLDTGDFVLAASDGSILWESFSDPTDTILPTQTLLPDTKLVAMLSDDDFSDGRFKLEMQSDGNIVLYQIAVPTGYQYSSYWSPNYVTPNSTMKNKKKREFFVIFSPSAVEVQRRGAVLAPTPNSAASRYLIIFQNFREIDVATPKSQFHDAIIVLALASRNQES